VDELSGASVTVEESCWLWPACCGWLEEDEGEDEGEFEGWPAGVVDAAGCGVGEEDLVVAA